jgi:hypothetical protein
LAEKATDQRSVLHSGPTSILLNVQVAIIWDETAGYCDDSAFTALPDKRHWTMYIRLFKQGLQNFNIFR